MIFKAGAVFIYLTGFLLTFGTSKSSFQCPEKFGVFNDTDEYGYFYLCEFGLALRGDCNNSYYVPEICNINGSINRLLLNDSTGFSSLDNTTKTTGNSSFENSNNITEIFCSENNANMNETFYTCFDNSTITNETDVLCSDDNSTNTNETGICITFFENNTDTNKTVISPMNNSTKINKTNTTSFDNTTQTNETEIICFDNSTNSNKTDRCIALFDNSTDINGTIANSTNVNTTEFDNNNSTSGDSTTKYDSENSPFKCPSQGGLFPDVRDKKCHDYWDCTDVDQALQTCEGDKIFNPVTNNCDQKAACSGYWFKCTIEFGYLVDPKDPQKYYQCYYGIPYPWSCLSGEVFDTKNNRCLMLPKKN